MANSKMEILVDVLVKQGKVDEAELLRAIESTTTRVAREAGRFSKVASPEIKIKPLVNADATRNIVQQLNSVLGDAGKIGNLSNLNQIVTQVNHLADALRLLDRAKVTAGQPKGDIANFGVTSDIERRIATNQRKLARANKRLVEYRQAETKELRKANALYRQELANISAGTEIDQAGSVADADLRRQELDKAWRAQRARIKARHAPKIGGARLAIDTLRADAGLAKDVLPAERRTAKSTRDAANLRNWREIEKRELAKVKGEIERAGPASGVSFESLRSSVAGQIQALRQRSRSGLSVKEFTKTQTEIEQLVARGRKYKDQQQLIFGNSLGTSAQRKLDQALALQNMASQFLDGRAITDLKPRDQKFVKDLISRAESRAMAAVTSTAGTSDANRAAEVRRSIGDFSSQLTDQQQAAKQKLEQAAKAAKDKRDYQEAISDQKIKEVGAQAQARRATQQAVATQRVQERGEGFIGREQVLSQTVQGRNDRELKRLTEAAVKQGVATPIRQPLLEANAAEQFARAQRAAGDVHGAVASLRTAEQKLTSYAKGLTDVETRTGVLKRVAALQSQAEQIEPYSTPMSRIARFRELRGVAEARRAGREALERVGGIAGIGKLTPADAPDVQTFIQTERARLARRIAQSRSGLGPQWNQDEIARAQQTFAQLGAGSKMMAEKVRDSVHPWHRLTNAVKSFATYGLVYAGGFTLVQKLIEGTRAVIDFEQALKGIQAISQATYGDMIRIGSGIKEVASDSRFSIAEITKATQLLAQAGVPAAELPGTLKQVEQYSSATDTPLETGADTITSMRNIYKGVSDKVLTDQLTNAINISKLQGEDLKTILSLAGQPAKARNISSEQLLAMAATANQLGIKPSTLATGFRQSLAEILSPDKKTLTAFQKLYGKIGEPADAGAVRKRLAGLQYTDDPISAILNELKRLGVTAENKQTFSRATDIRAENWIMALVGNQDLYNKFLGEIPVSGAAAEGARTQMEGFRATLQELGNELVAIGSSVGDSVLPAFRSLAGFMAKGLKTAGEAVRSEEARIPGTEDGSFTAAMEDKRILEARRKAQPQSLVDEEALRQKNQQEQDAQQRLQLETARNEFTPFKLDEEGGETFLADKLLRQVKGATDAEDLKRLSLSLSGTREKILEKSARLRERLARGQEITPAEQAQLDQLDKIQRTDFYKGVPIDTGNVEAGRQALQQQAQTMRDYLQSIWEQYGTQAQAKLDEFVSQQKSEEAKVNVDAIVRDIEDGRDRLANLAAKGDVETIDKTRAALAERLQQAESTGDTQTAAKIREADTYAQSLIPGAQAAQQREVDLKAQADREKAKQREGLDQPEPTSQEDLKQVGNALEQMLQNNRKAIENAAFKGDTKEVDRLISEQSVIQSAINRNKLMMAEVVGEGVDLEREAYRLAQEGLVAQNERNQQERLIGKTKAQLVKQEQDLQTQKTKLETRFQTQQAELIKAREDRAQTVRQANEDRQSFTQIKESLARGPKELTTKQKIELDLKTLQKMQQGGENEALRKASLEVAQKAESAYREGELSKSDADTVVRQAETYNTQANDALKAQAFRKEAIAQAKLNQTATLWRQVTAQLDKVTKSLQRLASLKVNYDTKDLDAKTNALLAEWQEKLNGRPLVIPTVLGEPGGETKEAQPKAAAGPEAPKAPEKQEEQDKAAAVPTKVEAPKEPPTPPAEPSKPETPPLTPEAPQAVAEPPKPAAEDQSIGMRAINKAGELVDDVLGFLTGSEEAQATETPTTAPVLVDKGAPPIQVNPTPIVNKVLMPLPEAEPRLLDEQYPRLPEVRVEVPDVQPVVPIEETHKPGGVMWDSEDLVSPREGLESMRMKQPLDFVGGAQGLWDNISEVPRIIGELDAALVNFPETFAKIAGMVPKFAEVASSPGVGAKILEAIDGMIPQPSQSEEDLARNLVNILMPLGAARTVAKPTEETTTLLQRLLKPEAYQKWTDTKGYLKELFGPDSFRVGDVSPAALGMSQTEAKTMGKPLNSFLKTLEMTTGGTDERLTGSTFKAFMSDLFGPDSFKVGRMTADDLASPEVARAMADIQHPFDSFVKSLEFSLKEADESFRPMVGLLASTPSEMSAANAGRMAIDSDQIRGLLKEAIGSPKLREASDEMLGAALDLRRGINAEKGLDSDIATGAIRDEIARRNGVTMLGLPEDNTAAERAVALGKTQEAYHGTAADFAEFDSSKRGQSAPGGGAWDAEWAAKKPSTSAWYAYNAAEKSDEATANIIPLRIDAPKRSPEIERRADVLDRAVSRAQARVSALKEKRSNSIADWAASVPPDLDVAEMTRRWDEFYSSFDVEGAEQKLKSLKAAQADHLKRNPKPIQYMRGNHDIDVINDGKDNLGPYLQKAPEATSVFQFDNLKDPFFAETHYALLKKSSARSRFAAFDPARKSEGNLLASTPDGVNKLGVAAALQPDTQQEPVEVQAPELKVEAPETPEAIKVETPKVEVQDSTRVEPPRNRDADVFQALQGAIDATQQTPQERKQAFQEQLDTKLNKLWSGTHEAQRDNSLELANLVTEGLRTKQLSSEQAKEIAAKAKANNEAANAALANQKPARVEQPKDVVINTPQVKVEPPKTPEAVKVDAPEVKVEPPKTPEAVKVDAPRVDVVQPSPLQVHNQYPEGETLRYEFTTRPTLAQSSAAFDAIDDKYNALREEELNQPFLDPDLVEQANEFARAQAEVPKKRRLGDSLVGGAPSQEHSEDYQAGAVRSFIDGRWVQYSKEPLNEGRAFQQAGAASDVDSMRELIEPKLLRPTINAADGSEATPSSPVLQGLLDKFNKPEIRLPESAFSQITPPSLTNVGANDTAYRNAENLGNTKTPVTLNFPEFGSFPVEAEDNVVQTLVTALNTAAAKLGGR